MFSSVVLSLSKPILEMINGPKTVVTEAPTLFNARYLKYYMEWEEKLT